MTRKTKATQHSTDVAPGWVAAGTPASKIWSAVINFKGFRYWQFWVAIAIAVSGGIGGLSYHLMLRQPGPPQCDQVFWPFASASLRLYCAQEKANQPSLENLYEAIALVDALGPNHPLRPAINPLVEHWSNQSLDLAEEAFHEGDLNRAIEFARKIPTQTTAHNLVKDRIERWRVIWAQGESIFAKAEAALEQQEDWRKAFKIMVRLVEVDNRYWASDQYEVLNLRIIGAQQDEIKLGKIKRLRRTGTLDNLAKALRLCQELTAESIFRKSAQSEVNQISQRLMQIAGDALNRQNLDMALEALQIIPQTAALWPEAQDMTAIAYAQASTWEGSVISLEDAILRVRTIGPDRPLYAKAQALAAQWLGEIGHARLLSQAQTEAQGGTMTDLTTAILTAEQISAGSPFWDKAQADIQGWRRQLQTQEDTPILNQADQLSLRGDRAGLLAAIQQAQQIGPRRVLYDTAQARIQDWQNQLRLLDSPPGPVLIEQTQSPSPQTAQVWQQALELADQGTPESLVAAIETANRIPLGSPLHFQATRAMADWGKQLLSIAQSYVGTDPDRAIAIAAQIPPASSAYESAQIALQRWRQSAPSPTLP